MKITFNIKTILVALLMIFLVYSSYSQDFSFGLKAGLNLATVNGDDVTGVQSKAGFHVGAFASFKFTKFGIQGEALFSSQGTQDENDSDFKINNDYLLIPVLAKFYLVQGLNIYAGPQFGILLSSETTDGTVDVDTKDLFKSSDISLVFGAGFEISKFQVGARYNLGLSDIIEDPLPGDSSVKNGVFQIYVGFALVKK